MAHRPLTITLAATAVTAVALAAPGAAFAQAPAESSGQPNIAKPGVEVVGGYLAASQFQAAINQAEATLQAKRAAQLEVMRKAVIAKWQAEAEAARIAAEQAAAEQAAAEQAAYEQAVWAAAAENMRARAYSAPVQNYSAPVESYSAPTETYSAPVESYSAPASSYSGGAASGDAASWASSGAAMAVKQCESGNNYSTNTGNGYYGAWQFDAASWLANGGGAYAPTADQAPSWAQDQVAYNYYSVAGWGPWECAQ